MATKANFTRTLMVLLALILLLAVEVLPALAAAGTVTLTITNKTGVAVRVTLSGDRSYSINAAPGKTDSLISPGNYMYSYQACGKTINKKLKVSGTKAKINIAACPMANIKFMNETHGGMTMYLRGPASYKFVLVPGTTTVKVIKGSYTYTSYACGGHTRTGDVKITHSIYWRWWCT